MARWSDYGWFPPSRPRKAEGGIKARSKRGFAQQWWAKRWIAALEALNLGGRLSRGRSYARSGQVLSIEIDRNRVAATVQGSRPTPYQVSIGVTALSRSDWTKLTRVLSGSPLHVAKLIAGEMPEDIESLFYEAGITLFPARASELRTDCSCPDWSNPCKHIAAVYYLLGEEFDRDPFLIFKLRGVAREELASIIGSAAPPKRERSKPPVAPPKETAGLTPGAPRRIFARRSNRSTPPPQPSRRPRSWASKGNQKRRVLRSRPPVRDRTPKASASRGLRRSRER